MPFTQATFFRQENNGLRDVFTTYNYQTDDGIAEITQPQYFLRNPRYTVIPKDVVRIQCADGFFICSFIDEMSVQIEVAGGGGFGAEVIVETVAPYTITGVEDVVRINGGGAVMFPDVNLALKRVDVYADGGDVTPGFVNGESTNQPVISNGNAATMTPFPVKNAWDAT